jgi:hypothetical protein
MLGMSSENLAKKAKQHLKDGLVVGGITDTRIEHEIVQGTRYVRLKVTSKKFGNLGHAERQAVVWRILERALPPVDFARISIVLTLTPEEQAGR